MSSIVFHNSIDCGQPQSRSLPLLFGGEKGFKDMIFNRSCHFRNPVSPTEKHDIGPVIHLHGDEWTARQNLH